MILAGNVALESMGLKTLVSVEGVKIPGKPIKTYTGVLKLPGWEATKDTPMAQQALKVKAY
jgi:hypothetical protein